MSKEKVFIVTTHYKKPKKNLPGMWESREKVEFLNRVRANQLRIASVVIDYLDEKVVVGSVKGVKYDEYINYLHLTYPKQMDELKKAYKPDPEVQSNVVECIDGELVVTSETA